MTSDSTSFVKRLGTVGVNTDTDQVVLIELSVKKSDIGLSESSSFGAAISIENRDDSSTLTPDTMDNVYYENTASLAKIVLDK